MPVPKQFWLALESVPGLATSIHEWRALLGPEWGWAKSLLRPMQHEVETMPIGADLYRVVVHSPDRIVAVPLDGGPTRPLPRDDVRVYQLHVESLVKCLCTALGFERVSGNSLGAGGMRVRCGLYAATRVTKCPVHLCIQCDPAMTYGAIRRLLVSGEGPMIVLTPGRIDDEDLRQIVRLRRACHLCLDEVIEVDATGSATANERARHLLDAFRGTVEAWESGSRIDDPYCFQRNGRVWVLTFNCVTRFIPRKDARGLAYVQHLLARPRQEIPVELLDEMVSGNMSLKSISFGEAVIDREGLAKIWNEMQRVRGDIDKAEREGDAAAEARLRGELDQLSEQVRTANGLNDHVRATGDDTERLRTRITHAINRAVKVIEKDDLPTLSMHLDNALNRGKTMSYRPDSPIEWAF